MTAQTIEALEADLGEPLLPVGIAIRVLSGIAAANSRLIALVIVWGPAQRVCPGCNQADREPIRECPVTLDAGEVLPWDQRHECGWSWGPPWRTLNVDVDTYPGRDDQSEEAEALRGAVSACVWEAIEQVGDEVAEREARLVTEARAELRRVLATVLESAVAGVIRDGDAWVAWCQDPSLDAEPDDLLEERASAGGPT